MLTQKADGGNTKEHGLPVKIFLIHVSGEIFLLTMKIHQFSGDSSVQSAHDIVTLLRPRRDIDETNEYKIEFKLFSYSFVSAASLRGREGDTISSVYCLGIHFSI